MLNNGLKKAAFLNLKEVNRSYEKQNIVLMKDAEKLYKERVELKSTIDESWLFINSIRNIPEELATEVKEIKLGLEKYSALLEVVINQIKKTDFKAAGTVGAGLATGAGVASFGPSAALGIAMTFGTASTGTAISTLSGAAATNAALAWLGGGALTIGGSGMAGGSTLLVLAGPVGWAIGGAGVLAGGLIANGKNKADAEKANSVALEIKAEVRVLKGLSKEIELLTNTIQLFGPNLENLVIECRNFNINYSMLEDTEKYILGTLVNNTKSSVMLLNKGIGEKV